MRDSRIPVPERFERRAERYRQRLVVSNELARHIEVRVVPSLRSSILREEGRAGGGRVLTEPAGFRENEAPAFPGPL